jgi:hypothetical protein
VAVGGARDAEATGNGWPTAAGVRVLGKERERERERERARTRRDPLLVSSSARRHTRTHMRTRGGGETCATRTLRVRLIDKRSRGE